MPYVHRDLKLENIEMSLNIRLARFYQRGLYYILAILHCPRGDRVIFANVLD